MTTVQGGVELPYTGNFLLVTTLTFVIAACLVVILRIIFRVIRRTTGPSDYCIVLAMSMSLTHSVFDALSVTHYGYGYHEADLPHSEQFSVQPLLLFWLGQILFKLSTLFTKLSLFFIYRALFANIDTKWTRVAHYANYITASIVVGYYTAAALVSAFSCTPVHKAWNVATPGTCINSTAFLYSTAFLNVVTSIALITLPLPVLFQTKHQRSEITQLICLILLGLIDTATSIARMVLISSSSSLAKNDTTWTLIPSVTAAVIEMNVAIIAASLVVMRPCFKAIHVALFGRSGHTTLSGRQTYVLSTNAQRSFDNKITKTVDIQLSSRSVSTEDILNGQDRF